MKNRDEVKHDRKFTFKYFFLLELEDGNEQNKVQVCKPMFLNTHAISERPVKTAWKKYDNSKISDLRGKHTSNRNIFIDKNMIDSVIAHVNSFVPVEAHYVRKSSKKLYLDGNLSFHKMLAEYKIWEPENLNNINVTLRQYRDIVKKYLNISFFRPKNDRCSDMSYPLL